MSLFTLAVFYYIYNGMRPEHRRYEPDHHDVLLNCIFIGLLSCLIVFSIICLVIIIECIYNYLLN